MEERLKLYEDIISKFKEAEEDIKQLKLKVSDMGDAETKMFILLKVDAMTALQRATGAYKTTKKELAKTKEES